MADVLTFLEKDVCDGSAWGLKWGTVVLESAGLVFHYNRPRQEAPGRMLDVIKLKDVPSVSLETIDWLVSKIFWVGRNLVVVKTKEGEKRYYMRKTGEVFTALTLLSPGIKIVDNSKNR